MKVTEVILSRGNLGSLKGTCSAIAGTRKMVNYAWARQSQGKL
jgi:hypothetical protein